MSWLHVTQNGRKKTFYLEDGKNILDRFVNLDTGYMHYFMGKQIAGKPIKPNGALGKELRRLSVNLMNRPEDQKAEKPKASPLQWIGLFIMVWILLVFLLHSACPR